MDSNSMQSAKQVSKERKKPYLILEARHTMSLEAANKIRSKLLPRIFIPRTPVYSQIPNYRQCAKEFKGKFIRNRDSNGICKTKAVLFKRSQGKSGKKLQREKNNARIKLKTKLTRSTNRIRVCKTLKKRQKRTLKKLRYCLAMAIKNLEQPIDMTAKEFPLKNCKNLKIIKHKNAKGTSCYIAGHDKISLEDPLALNLSVSLHKDKKDTGGEHAQTNIGTILKNPELVKKNNSNLSNLQKDKQPTKLTLKSGVISKNTNVLGLKKSSNSVVSVFKSIATEVPSGKPLDKIKKETTDYFPEININAIEKERQEASGATNQLVESISKNNLMVANKETSMQRRATNCCEKNNKLSCTENVKQDNTVTEHPLSSLLSVSTNAALGFQHLVRSSISLTCDCSAEDKSINAHLMILENCVDTFSKCAMQSYSYLDGSAMKVKKRGAPYSNRPQHTTPLKQPNNKESISDTLTILIEAPNLLKKTITYKTSDILYPKPLSGNPGTSEKNFTDGSNPNLDATTFMANNIAKEFNRVDNTNCTRMDIQKKNRNHTRLRKKVTAIKANSLRLNNKNQALTSLANTAHCGNTNGNYSGKGDISNHANSYANPIYMQTETNNGFALRSRTADRQNFSDSAANYQNFNPAGQLLLVGDYALPIQPLVQNPHGAASQALNQNPNHLRDNSDSYLSPKSEYHPIPVITYNGAQLPPIQFYRALPHQVLNENFHSYSCWPPDTVS